MRTQGALGERAENNPGKKGNLIGRRASLFAIAGLVSAIWLAGSFTSVPSASAQPTQTEIKQKTKKGAAKTREKWQSLPQ